MREEWKEKSLGGVCENLDSRRKPITQRDRTTGNIPYYGATGIVDYVNNYLFDEKLVLLGEDGAKWNSGDKCAFIIEGKSWVNNHAHVLRPNKNILLDEWLVYNLNFQDLTRFISGMTVPKLNQGKMNEIKIPIPSLFEQKRIVEILDETFATIDKAKANFEKNLQNAKELFESYLENVFENKGKDWEKKRLADITEVKDGTHDSPKYIKEGIPFVTQKNIRVNGLTLKDTKFITEEDHNKFYKRSNVAYGDIIISMIGANRGMACVVDDERLFSIKNVGLVKKTDAINQSYLLYYLKSPMGKEYIKQSTNGGAQEFVGLAALRNFPILFAPRKDQNLIVEKLNKLKFETKRLEAIYEQKLNDLEELKKSILQKAFNGELTAKESAI